MPYRRRHKFRFRRRRFTRRRRPGMLRRFIRKTVTRMSEKKFFHTDIEGTVSNANIQKDIWFRGLQQGLTVNNRIGNRISVIRYSFRFTIRFNFGAGGDQRADARVMVLWPQKGIAVQDLTNYLTDLQPGTWDRVDPSRYLVLYDRHVHLSAVEAGSGADHSISYHKFSRTCKEMIVTYDATNEVDRSPVFYVTTPMATGNASNIRIDGWLGFSFRDF